MKESFTAGSGRAKIAISQTDLPLKAYTSIHDDLYANVLILKGSQNVVLASIDLTSLPDHAVHAFQEMLKKESGIHHVFISVTHSFSSPHIPQKVHNENEKRLNDFLMERIGDALKEACANAIQHLSACELAYGNAECTLNVNRNVLTKDGYWLGENKNGFSDHKLRTLIILKKQKPEAVICMYDIQSSLLDKAKGEDGGLLISSDFIGEAAQILAQKGITLLFMPGCAGDQAPLRKDHNIFDQVQKNADQLAMSILQSIKDAESVSLSDFQLITKTHELPSQIMKIPTNLLTPHKSFSFEKGESPVHIESTLLEIGSVRLFLTMPELNSFYGEKIRDILGEKTMIATLVNGARKYLPEESDYEKITYNAMNTMIGKGADQEFLNEVRKMKEACV